MATTETRPFGRDRPDERDPDEDPAVGIDHPTVVPTNFDPE